MDTLKSAKSRLAAVNKDLIGFINAFADEQSFVETDAFVCSETALADAVGEGVVSGFASIDGNGVCLFATNPKVLKGSVGARGAQKITRAVNNAVRMDKPLIAIWDTSGARFAEGIDVLEGYGSILRAYTVAYGEVPIISIIKGNDFGLSAYVAGLSDFVIAYPTSAIATASPLVLSAKTGKTDVGTAQDAAACGLVTQIVKNDGELRLRLQKMLTVFTGGAEYGDDPNRVSKNLKCGANVDAFIKEVFDKDSFFPVRAEFAPVVVTGFASLGDIPVGLVATDSKQSDGRLSFDACVKINEFLNTCENAECPVVFAVDSAGTEQSENDVKLIREMSDLVYRVNTLDIDMFAVVYGKAIGAAYTVLVSPCEYKIAWECAQIGALESESAARLLYADEIKSAKNKDKATQKLSDEYCAEHLSALAVAGAGHIDNVIEPNLTRQYLLAALLAHVE